MERDTAQICNIQDTGTYSLHIQWIMLQEVIAKYVWIYYSQDRRHLCQLSKN